MDDCPLFQTNEIRRRVIEACPHTKETAPAREVIEVGCRSTSNNAIEVVRKHLCGLHALATTSGATKIVGFCEIFAVEQLGDLLTYDNAGMNGTPSEVFHDLRRVEESLP